MIRSARYILAMCIIMLCCSTYYGQRRDVRDKALDRYEVICNRLIELRDAFRRGETISNQEVTALMAEVKTIRSNLNQSPGGLTPKQIIRFNRIRRRYNYGIELKELSFSKKISKVPVVSDIKLDNKRLKNSNYWEDHIFFPPKNGFLTIAQVSLVPDISFGLSIGVLKQQYGAYLSFTSNFKSKSADIEVLSDGTSRGETIWISGRQEKTKIEFTAGGILRVADHVNLFAGAGYGIRNLFWENSGGNWMKVTDCSYSGIAAEAGALFTLGWRESFCLSAKVGTIAFKYMDFTIGIGYRF